MEMWFGDTHVTSAHRDIEPLMHDFGDELNSIINLHRYVVITTEREFTAVYERLLSKHNPEFDSYDGGDAIYDAEKELGFEPWSVQQHMGLLTLARAVALAEIVMARLAAACWAQPELTVFPRGRTWTRRWEREFYLTCLNQTFDPNSNGFGALRDLRDLYAHGYGVPVRAIEHQQLAARLHQHFDTSGPTPDENALGYTGPASFFGPYAKFDKTTGLGDDLLRSLPEANLTPVAVYRALQRIRAHVARAAEAVRSHPRDDVESSKFVKTVEAWWLRPENSGMSDK